MQCKLRHVFAFVSKSRSMGPPDTWARWFDSLAPSNVDWCEANYAISPYVAEFWNAMSSVPMTGVAFYGFYMARRHLRYEPRWGMAWFMLGIVGLGSALFHATLKHAFQACDELPMLYCNLVFIYLMLEEKSAGRSPPWRVKAANLKPPRKRWLAPLLIASGVVQTACYFLYPHVYELFLVYYVPVVAWLTIESVRRAWFAPDATPLTRTLVKLALTFYLGGAALWIFENAVCGTKGEMGGGWWMQAAHLHAFWHAGACMGTYHFIEFCAARRGTALYGSERVSAGGGTMLMPLYVIHDQTGDGERKRR